MSPKRLTIPRKTMNRMARCRGRAPFGASDVVAFDSLSAMNGTSYLAISGYAVWRLQRHRDARDHFTKSTNFFWNDTAKPSVRECVYEPGNLARGHRAAWRRGQPVIEVPRRRTESALSLSTTSLRSQTLWRASALMDRSLGEQRTPAINEWSPVALALAGLGILTSEKIRAAGQR